MINKKAVSKIFIIIILLSIIIFAIIQIRNTLARYESMATTERDVDVAFWIVDNSFKSQRLLLGNIFPSAMPFEYTFTVSNFNGTKSAETDLEYELEIITTTNLPLSYEISKNGTPCTNIIEELYSDEDDTFYRKIKLETDTHNLIMDEGTDTTDTFVIKVTFPESNSINLEYADLMEYINLNLNAKQIIGE